MAVWAGRNLSQEVKTSRLRKKFWRCIAKYERGSVRMGQCVMDNSILSRKQEIGMKLARVRQMLDLQNLRALYIAKCEGFEWITADTNGGITCYVEKVERPDTLIINH